MKLPNGEEETGEETECRGCSDIDVCDKDTGLCPRCQRAMEDVDEGFEDSPCLTDAERNPGLR